MDTSVNAANQVVSVGADIAFDADPKFFACLVRFESSSVPTKTQSEPRSEERFSRNAETDLVCRLLLEKKKETRASRSTSGARRPRRRWRPWCVPLQSPRAPTLLR